MTEKELSELLNNPRINIFDIVTVPGRPYKVITYKRPNEPEEEFEEGTQRIF